MRKMTALLLLCSATACVPSAAAQTFPDRGRAAVVDAANVIPDDQERALNARLVAWERDSHHQLVVATVPSLQGYDIKDFGYKLFRHWALGRKGVNDGVVLLLAPNERKVRIEVGYGLEPVLTDATTSDMIGTYIVPHLKQNEIPEALSSGADVIMGAVNASETPQQVASDATKAQRAKDDGSSAWWWLLLALPFGLVSFAGYRWRKSTMGLKSNEIPAILSSGSPPTSSRRSSSSARGRRATCRGYYAAGAAAASSYSSSSSYDSSSSSSSYDSGSSSSGGYGSGGGSCGGGGSDSSY